MKIGIGLGVPYLKGVASPSGPTFNLLNNLVAFYEFGGSAGSDVIDSHGNADTLVDFNTVGRVAGVNGTAADFNIANDQYFWISPAAGNVFEFAGDFSMCAWIYIVALPSKGGGACYQFIFSRPSGYKGYSFRVAAIGSEIPASISSDNPVPASAISHSDLPGSGVGSWWFVCMVNKASVQIESWFNSDGVMAQTPVVSPIAYTFTQTVAGYADTFIGRQGTSATSGRLYIDSIAVFNKALAEDELNWLYNSGSGRTYAALE